MSNEPTTAQQPLTHVELEGGLRSIEPSQGWLKHGRVENLLGWHVGAIQQFLKSNQPEQRGSTRRNTPLCNAEVELGKAGMHFNEGRRQTLKRIAHTTAPRGWWWYRHFR